MQRLARKFYNILKKILNVYLLPCSQSLHNPFIASNITNKQQISLARYKLFFFKCPVAIICILLVITGCSPQNGKTLALGHVLKHAMGETNVPAQPQRVIVLTNEACDITLALGIKPIASVLHWVGKPWYKYLENEMEGVTLIGNELQPDLEKIASLKPDLILGSKVRHEKIYPHLNAIAPTVFSETIGSTWKENTILYAKALNKESQKEALLTKWDTKVREFKQKIGNHSPEVSIIRFQEGVVRLYYQGFPTAIINEIGLKRPSNQQRSSFSANISIEQIAEIDTDIIFYFVASSLPGKETHASSFKDAWVNNSMWKNLNAVKRGKVYQVDEVTWNMAGGIQAAFAMLKDLEQIFNVKPLSS